MMQAQADTIQSQMSKMQSQMENRLSGLRDELLSHTETVAVETLPATKSLSVSTGMEHVHKCMNDGVNDDASENLVLLSMRSAEMSSATSVAENPLSVDAAASLADNNYSTQPPIRSGSGSWDNARVAIAGTLGFVNESSVAPSAERQQSVNGSVSYHHIICGFYSAPIT